MTTVLRIEAGDREVITRADVREQLRLYVRLYGDDMPQSAFSPSQAKRNGRRDLLDRYRRGRPAPDGSFPEPAIPWISLNAIKSKYDGSWSAARADVGLSPNTTGPTDKRPRRPPGAAEPILERERRVVVASDATTKWLRTQLAAAERRVARLAKELDEAKARVVEVPVEDVRQIEALRHRLADETHRRKETKRELHNAVRREARARASSARGDRRQDAAALREVDRLTDRLANAQDEIRELRGYKPKPKTVTKTKTRTVTKTVKDPVMLRNVEKLEAQVSELRLSLARSETARAEAVEQRAEIRRDAIAEAAATQLVQAAERRVGEVEKRMSEMAELLVGERRQLTSEELENLRRDGPAAERLFVNAVRRIGHAYGREARKQAIYNALVEGFNWMDRL